MSFLSLVGVEFKKIKRSKILLILFVATVILWIPSILNAHMNFDMQAEGISPENNFFIQGFMGMSWFMFPASMVVGTVLLSQTERANKGILKMLALPISTAKLCFLAFVGMYSDADFFYRYRIGFDCAVRTDDQYKSVVCLSNVVSVLCDNGRIWKTCNKSRYSTS